MIACDDGKQRLPALNRCLPLECLHHQLLQITRKRSSLDFPRPVCRGSDIERKPTRLTFSALQSKVPALIMSLGSPGWYKKRCVAPADILRRPSARRGISLFNEYTHMRRSSPAASDKAADPHANFPLITNFLVGCRVLFGTIRNNEPIPSASCVWPRHSVDGIGIQEHISMAGLSIGDRMIPEFVMSGTFAWIHPPTRRNPHLQLH